MAGNANARRAPGAAAARLSNDAAENSVTAANGQGGAKRPCPRCARKCAKFVAVQGWHAGRATLLCKRCAGGLIIVGGRVARLKLAPEVKGTLEARP
jgi:hypothetical protein